MTQNRKMGSIKEKVASFSEKLKHGYNPMIEGVRWTEYYATNIDKYWKRIPDWLRQVIVFISIFILASGLQGIYKLWFLCFSNERNHFKVMNKEMYKFIASTIKILFCFQFETKGKFDLLLYEHDKLH